MPSLSGALLAGTLLLSTVGTHLAFTPPSPASEPTTPSPTDTLGVLHNRSLHFLPLGLTLLIPLFTLHLALLSLFHPSPPPWLLRKGTKTLNPRLTTWSLPTVLPVAINLLVGVPLRLISYGTLGRNFTFSLSEPDGLMTDGIYGYVQHPSYTGLIACFPVLIMLCRADGVMSCWIPRRWYPTVKKMVNGVLIPAWVAWSVFLITARVLQEEAMLRDKFGAEWEEWHARTARFVPGII